MFSEFERNLEEDVRNETSGDFGDFLIMLLEVMFHSKLCRVYIQNIIFVKSKITAKEN